MKFEFIIPTYNRPHSLMMTIHSIYAQTCDAWKIHVVADAVFDGLEKIATYFKGDDRIKFSTVDGGPHNNWGHTPRLSGLSVCNEEWVVMTGDDNYYFPIFLEECKKAIDKNPKLNFVYCDMYHNLSNYTYHAAKPKIQGMDIGNFASRPELSRQVPFPINRHDGDGVFVEGYVQRFCKDPDQIHSIGRGLYVHN